MCSVHQMISLVSPPFWSRFKQDTGTFWLEQQLGELHTRTLSVCSPQLTLNHKLQLLFCFPNRKLHRLPVSNSVVFYSEGDAQLSSHASVFKSAGSGASTNFSCLSNRKRKPPNRARLLPNKLTQIPTKMQQMLISLLAC